jgi:2-(1,2-epoxy-1,2-dihydrophenyl)acetyl-CoA isomerase
MIIAGTGRRTETEGWIVAGEVPNSGVHLDRSGSVVTITVHGSAGRGALDETTKIGLGTELTALAADPQVRAVVLTGAAGTFCVGQDLKEHAAALAVDATGAWDTLRAHYNPIVQALATMPKPVIAAINGTAAGAGVGFALACDVRLAADSAVLHLAFPGIGLSLDSGLSWTLPRLVGYGRALELALRPRPIPAAEALTLGLVAEVVPAATLAARAAAVAAELAAGPTVAFAAIKQALAYSAAHPLPDALDVEAALQTVAGVTADHAAAVAAFLAKRPPTFEGR